MRKLFFSLFLLAAVPSVFASDVTKASVLSGSPGRIVDLSSLEGCEAGHCYLLLTNNESSECNDSLRVEVRMKDTDYLVACYGPRSADDVVLKVQAQDFHILKTRKGTRLYTNADLGKN